MWRKTMGMVSRAIRNDYPHDFAGLPCMKLELNQGLGHGLLAPSSGTAYIMIKPDSGTLAMYVFAEESYRSVLSTMGDVVDSEFDFSSVTDRNLFLAVHRHGHFFQSIDTKSVMKEISEYALQHSCTFLLQLDSIDLDLSPLHRKISYRLQTIRTPKRVKDEKGYHTENHPEKEGDLDRGEDEILNSLRSRPCSSAAFWCFSDNPPGVGFAGSEASVSWLHVDSDIIAKRVTLGSKLLRLIIKPKHSEIWDIFNSERGTHYMIRFIVRKIIWKEINRYLTKRKNSPVFFFDGSVWLDPRNVQSSGSVDSPSQTRPESLDDVGY